MCETYTSVHVVVRVTEVKSSLPIYLTEIYGYIKGTSSSISGTSSSRYPQRVRDNAYTLSVYNSLEPIEGKAAEN